MLGPIGCRMTAYFVDLHCRQQIMLIISWQYQPDQRGNVYRVHSAYLTHMANVPQTLYMSSVLLCNGL
jgi:hypothetical protein